MANASKPRQPRLRASCDGCFLAKVKCSKARPICSRCLTCGIECRYSPSSRAGKPKASETAKNQRQSTPTLGRPPQVTNDGMVYTVGSGIPGVYQIETGWTTPPTSIDGALSRSESISSGLTFMGVDNTTGGNVDSNISGDIYGPSMPWTPPQDMPATFTDPPMTATLPPAHSRSQSYDMNTGTVGWADSNAPEMFSFNSQVSTPPNMGSNYFPSPVATPNMRTVPPRPKSTPINSTGGSCTCFTVCLQSLQALHNASSASSPPFDLVLSLNRKAVEGCAAMLACSRCMTGFSSHTSAMLLATVIGTISTFYKNASQSYFDQGASANNGNISAGLLSPSTTPSMPSMPIMPTMTTISGLGVSLGVYTVNSEDSRWLELEILARELRKLEEVYTSFREVCSELSEDLELSKAIVGYLGHSLGSTIQVVSHRKGDMGFS